ncbi:MAG: AMP phosphorylase [Candidatus Aenigmatarchaeota archaeon]
MKLVARPIDIEVGGKNIVIMNKDDIETLSLRPLDRVKIKHNGKELSAVVDETKKFTIKGEIVTNDEVTKFFELSGGENLEVIPACVPESMCFIRQKLAGNRLEYPKLRKIVEDVVNKNLSNIELSSFVTALYTRGISIDEATGLTKAMVETGKRISFPGKMICDKHSIGGLAGDKTSMILVPIVAAAGLTIPKSSSKAITSPCGTAERMEVLAPVNLNLEEIVEVVKKTNACLVWGGALDISPADDMFIQIEYPLGIDPLLLPSIMSKKKAIGSHYLVVDIPVGKETKMKTVEEAMELADDFVELGKRLGIHVVCGVTFGEQPLGHYIGPALEAKEALLTLQNKGPRDVIEKATNLAGLLFETVGAGDKNTALQILKSGKAEKKMREIIEAQGGNPKVQPDDMPIGSDNVQVRSKNEGRVLWIKNSSIIQIARRAGTPKDKGAGIHLKVKMGDEVKKGDVLFTIYSNNYMRLNDAFNLSEEQEPIIVGKKFEEKMLLDKLYSELPKRRTFMIER